VVAANVARRRRRHNRECGPESPMDVPRRMVRFDASDAHPRTHKVGSLLTARRRSCTMYNMKRVTASEARRDWFRLLDEVAAGEVVVVERKGRRIVIQRETKARAADPSVPDYRAVLSVPAAELADTWTWEWDG